MDADRRFAGSRFSKINGITAASIVYKGNSAHAMIPWKIIRWMESYLPS
jgi:hypothetical protein